MKCRTLFLIIAISCFSDKLCAQLSGVINQYTPVTNISCNQVDVVSAASFSPGDRVLIIQMKGAEINTSNTAAFGSVTNYKSCGNYEFGVISSISGNTIVLQNQLLYSYEASGRVQLIHVPQYTDVTVTNTIMPQAWNGTTGGVLVMEVSGTLTLNASVSASGRGFRGAFGCANPDGGCGNFQDYFYPVSSGMGAEKGEGIAEVPNTMNGGRGALANGGGGGNKHNSGGGGGSNAMRGGRGGSEASFCGSAPIGGEGGDTMDYTLGKIFMGGGGGSPDHNDNVGISGANGGGIIIIRATAIVSNNAIIESSGNNAGVLPNSIGDGAGGGGGGGVIVLDAGSVTGTLPLFVSGGNGGDQETTYPSCFGPGGGGGAGAILLTSSQLPIGVPAIFIMGMAGVHTNGSSACYSESYGATPGEGGSETEVLYYNVVLPESNISLDGIDLGPDVELCATSYLIDPGLGPISGVWSTGQTSPTLSVTSSGEYWFSVNLGGDNCSFKDTIVVTLNGFLVDAGPDQSICEGENTVLHAVSANVTNLDWSGGVIDNQPFSPQETTVYTVTATDPTTGCTATDDVLVTVNPLPEIFVLPSADSGCAPFTLTFVNQSTNCADATWAFSDGTILQGCNNQQLTFENPGCYDLTLSTVSNSGCAGTKDFQSIICVLSSPTASFYPDPVILNSESSSTTMINNSVGGVQYEWDFGDGKGGSDEFGPAYSYSSDVFRPFTIRLKVTNENGCTAMAYSKVYMEGGLIYYVPNSFTPDGNQFNSVFLPVFTEGFDTKDYHFQVFNRWGETVFETNDLLTGWDGNYHGTLAPEGTYTWSILVKILGNGERKLIHGHVNLVK
ncbi:PKD domain protein [compost metagenome]